MWDQIPSGVFLWKTFSLHIMNLSGMHVQPRSIEASDRSDFPDLLWWRRKEDASWHGGHLPGCPIRDRLPADVAGRVSLPHWCCESPTPTRPYGTRRRRSSSRVLPALKEEAFAILRIWMLMNRFCPQMYFNQQTEQPDFALGVNPCEPPNPQPQPSGVVLLDRLGVRSSAHELELCQAPSWCRCRTPGACRGIGTV